MKINEKRMKTDEKRMKMIQKLRQNLPSLSDWNEAPEQKSTMGRWGAGGVWSPPPVKPAVGIAIIDFDPYYLSLNCLFKKTTVKK